MDKPRFITVKPTCDICHSSLEITELVIGFVNQTYELHASCIVCGEEVVILLRTKDIAQLDPLGGWNEEDSKN